MKKQVNCLKGGGVGDRTVRRYHIVFDTPRLRKLLALLSTKERKIVGLLTSSDARTRIEAIKPLQEMKFSKHMLSLIQPLIKDSSAEVRVNAIGIIRMYAAKTSQKAVNFYGNRAPEVQAQASRLFRRLRRENIPLLEGRLNDNSAEVRRAAIFALDVLNSKRSIPLINKKLADPDALVRFQTVFCLRDLKAKKSIPLIEGKLDDPNKRVRIQALIAIGELGSKQSVPLVERKLTDVPEVRSEAVSVLMELNSKRSVPLIEPLLRDPNPKVHSATVSALAALSDKPEHHRLYSNQPEAFFEKDRRRFAEFQKTHSQIQLIGGNLAGKAIVRFISESSFLGWKKAFEAESAWKEAGFDYVPIEPILRTKGGRLRAKK